VQIPVFIALYWVLLSAVELRNAPWIGWIKDLSAPDPYFVLPVVYAITAYLQVRLSPTPISDPVQAKVMQIMPIAFSVMFVFFPSGLVLYWLINNSLQIFQQWHMNRVLEKEARPRRGEAAVGAPAVDTIAAIATPSGRGAVGVVRVSGRDVPAMIEPLVARALVRASRLSRHFWARAAKSSTRALRCFSRHRTPTPESRCSSSTAMAARRCCNCCSPAASSSARGLPDRASSRCALS
jgi:hypothetical protein